jgi:hypothetical protein
LAAARLPNTTTTTGSFGGSGKVATFTVDSTGRLTAAGEAQISILKSAISDFPTIIDGSNAGNITSGTLAAARLPSGLAKTSGAEFSGEVSVTGTGKVILASSGDITAYRAADTTGVIFLNRTNTRYLYNNGTNYELPGQYLTINGSQALTEASGGTVTSAISWRSSGSVGTIGQSGSLAALGNGGAISTNHATMSFHRPGAYAINMGLDNDNAFRIGGWSDNTAGTTPYYRMTLDQSGNATFRNNVTAYSDARLKTNVETVTNALDKVLQMRGVTYERIDTGQKGVGVIAQEMKEVLPEVVMEAATDEEFMSVSYGNIVGVLIEAIKELKAEIEVLKGQNK